MAGLYIHIPFCKSRCIYCGFYSTTHLDLRQRYVDALCREMMLRSERAEGRGQKSEGRRQKAEDRDQRSEVRSERIETVYLGGGTPSQLTIEQLRQLFIYINKVYGLDLPTDQPPLPTHHTAPLREVTIEMNPDDVTVEYAAVLQQLPINRVSLGAQTFDDQRLRFLHRRHTAAQVARAVSILRSAGIRNISIDLMYGFPGETLSDWQRDIDAALALDVEHISAYCLMIEEGTPLARMMEQTSASGTSTPDPSPKEELERAMYELLIDKLTANGYEHYEISNFARPGYRSRHNSNYWHDVPYIGLGAAAHSYDISPLPSPTEGKVRRRSWNVSDIRAYIEAIEHGELPSEGEVLSDASHYNERVMLGLRTCEGVDLTTLSDHHRSYCLREAEPFLKDGLLRRNQDSLILTRRGLFVSDMVMSSLMLED